MPDQTIAALLLRIEKFMKRKKMSPTRFSRNACGNPSALSRIRSGVYSARVVGRIEAYLDANK